MRKVHQLLDQLLKGKLCTIAVTLFAPDYYLNDSATAGESNFNKVPYRKIAKKACNVPCCVAETQETQDCPTLNCGATGNQPWFLDPTKCDAQIKRYKNQKELFPDIVES